MADRALTIQSHGLHRVHMSSNRVIYAALLGNLAVALTKFVAAYLTRSSAMLSEGIHSLVDTGNQLLLLYGLRRAARPADQSHPLGYGREVYFWSFIVAVMIFALGGGLSIYEGISHMRDPEPIESAVVGYVVLALALAFEGASWWVALKEFRRAKGKLGYFRAVRQSKDPPSFMILFEDSAALLGLFIALCGTIASDRFDMPIADGLASVAIGLVLTLTAAILARESKGLLIGERARPEIAASALRIASQYPGVASANGIMTVHLAPREIVAALSLSFDPHLTAPSIETAVAAIETRIRAKHPEIAMIFVKPQSIEDYRGAHAYFMVTADQS